MEVQVEVEAVVEVACSDPSSSVLCSGKEGSFDIRRGRRDCCDDAIALVGSAEGGP